MARPKRTDTGLKVPFKRNHRYFQYGSDVLLGTGEVQQALAG
jgi:hypothetical protein